MCYDCSINRRGIININLLEVESGKLCDRMSLDYVVLCCVCFHFEELFWLVNCVPNQKWFIYYSHKKMVGRSSVSSFHKSKSKSSFIQHMYQTRVELEEVVISLIEVVGGGTSRSPSLRYCYTLFESGFERTTWTIEQHRQ